MAKSHVQDMSVELDHLIQSLYGSFKLQTIFAACELGIFDELSSGKATADELSGKLSINHAATTQLLDALVSLEQLEKHGKEDPHSYSNTRATERFLVKSSPDSIIGLVVALKTASGRMFDDLAWSVRKGTNQQQPAFDRSPAEFFKSCYATKEEKIKFLDTMRASSKFDASTFVTAFDLREFNHMCDLGGCTGDVGYAACMAYPKMKITVVDLPIVVEESSHFRPSADKCPNQENVSFFAADFFTDKLPSADLYVLSRVLHDWGEDKINLLLAKIFKSLQPGGGLLIGEILLKDDKTGPLIGNIQSLMMLAHCDTGARERSGPEYREMLTAHGFVEVQTKETQGIWLDAILARKP